MFFNWRRWLGKSATRRCGSKAQSHRPWQERLEERLRQSDSAPPRLITPLAGEPFKDWAITNYLDRDLGSGVRDFTGHTGVEAYTYDTHDGIDFAIASFTAQDVGVPVYAADDGTVIFIHD